MTNIKPGKKQNFTPSSATAPSKKMYEALSFTVDSSSFSVITNQKVNHSKASNSKNPSLLPNSDIDGLLESPVCSKSMFPPIQQLFNCFGQYFCLHFEALFLGTEPVYMAFLRFMGEESEARKFGYCLGIGGDGRKLTWHGVPCSIRTHHRIVRDSHDGLIVQRSMALYFPGGDRKELELSHRQNLGRGVNKTSELLRMKTFWLPLSPLLFVDAQRCFVAEGLFVHKLQFNGGCHGLNFMRY